MILFNAFYFNLTFFNATIQSNNVKTLYSTQLLNYEKYQCKGVTYLGIKYNNLTWFLTYYLSSRNALLSAHVLRTIYQNKH